MIISEQRPKKVLPMDFEILRDLETVSYNNLTALQTIRFVVNCIPFHHIPHEEIGNIAEGVVVLLDIWMKNYIEGVDKTVADFESMDLFLINKAETIIKNFGDSPLPLEEKIKQIKKVIADMDLILDDPALPHDKALQLKVECLKIIKGT